MIFTLIRRSQSVKRKNNLDFVTWMRNHDIQFWESNEEFMQAYSHRKSTFEKIQLRYTSENEFVEDLLHEKLLTVRPAPSLWKTLQSKVLSAK